MKHILSILLLFTFANASFAQSILDKKINFKVTKLGIEATLFELIDQGDVVLSFDNSILPKSKILTINVKDTSIRSILNSILRDTYITYQVIGKQIILSQKIPEQKEIPNYTINGYLKDATSGEVLIGAYVYDSESERGAVTNAYGFYSLTLPASRYKLVISYLGYERKNELIDLTQNTKLDFELAPSLTLKTVIVNSEEQRSKAVTKIIGSSDIYKDHIAMLPGIGGESDIIKALHLLPGIQTGADGYGGFSVRGGGIDQNLIMLDGVPVYNASHAVGIYSIFDANAIKSTKLYKGIFPARYGGRSSSVVDIRTKEGNEKQWQGLAELGLTSAKFSVEGPIIKEKMSIFLSGRRSLLDLYSIPITRRLNKAGGFEGEVAYFFHDINAKINYKISENDRIYLSIYRGGDNFRDDRFGEFNTIDSLTMLAFTEVDSLEQSLSWGNTIAALRYNRQITSKFFANTTLTFSRFFYNSIDDRSFKIFTGEEELIVDNFFNSLYNSQNRDIAAKVDFDYVPNTRNYIRFGVGTTRHLFEPTFFFANQDSEELEPSVIDNPVQQSTETAIYFENEKQFTERFHVNFGARLLHLQSEDFGDWTFQPRLITSFYFTKNIRISAAGGRASQVMHLLSTSGSGLPRDLWVASTKLIQPVDSWQANGAFDIKINEWEIGIEAYTKRMDNLVDFKEGNIPSINASNWQNRVITGSGTSEGWEFKLSKVRGQTKGWAAYTFSRSDRTFEQANQGETFPFRFDRNHNFSLVAAHQLNEKWNMSLNWTFSSGSFTTLPLNQYLFDQSNQNESQIPIFTTPFQVDITSEKNGIQLPNYHRLDLGFDYTKKTSFGQSTLKISLYNVYSRFNPVYYQFVRRPDETGTLVPQYIETAYIPIIFPSVRYTAEF